MAGECEGVYVCVCLSTHTYSKKIISFTAQHAHLPYCTLLLWSIHTGKCWTNKTDTFCNQILHYVDAIMDIKQRDRKCLAMVIIRKDCYISTVHSHDTLMLATTEVRVML